MHTHFLILMLAATQVSAQTESVRADTVVPLAAGAQRPAAEVSARGPLMALSQPVGVQPRVRLDALPAQSVEYSDWYERRLTIHKWASYTTLPLFAFQYVAGSELYDESSDAPAWARNGHGVAATGIVALFGVNTVTGVWNLWDARKDPAGRKTRTTHAVLMLVADAGFAATGMLAEKAERSADNRRIHRTIAISSMSVATVSYLMMLPPFRRD
jgi:hypothetical protein